jgi:hypothetical protein
MASLLVQKARTDILAKVAVESGLLLIKKLNFSHPQLQPQHLYLLPNKGT